MCLGNMGGGGGGFVAIWINVSESDRNEYLSGTRLKTIVKSDTYAEYSGSISVVQGSGRTTPVAAGAGVYAFFIGIPPQGTVIMIL